MKCEYSWMIRANRLRLGMPATVRIRLERGILTQVAPMAEKAGALIGSNLHKRFLVKETGQTIHALNDVSLEISTGSLSALVGPDGAGKTTLLRMVAGLMTPERRPARGAGDRCCGPSTGGAGPHQLHAAALRTF